MSDVGFISSSPFRTNDGRQGLQPLEASRQLHPLVLRTSARRAGESASRPRYARPGLTLVEVICAITILSVIAAVVLPVLSGATDAYANASNTRHAVDSAAYAIERAVRLLRDAPPGTVQGAVGIAAATPQSVTFTDGRGLELSNGTLFLRQNATTTAPLCRNVTAFNLSYLSRDGVTSVIAAPTTTHRFNITLIAAGMELRTSAFPRVELMP